MKTEKRNAKVGESILIKKAMVTLGRYQEGDIFKVVQTEGPIPTAPDCELEDGEVLVEGNMPFIHPDEYEVIIGEEEA